MLNKLFNLRRCILLIRDIQPGRLGDRDVHVDLTDEPVVNTVDI